MVRILIITLLALLTANTAAEYQCPEKCVCDLQTAKKFLIYCEGLTEIPEIPDPTNEYPRSKLTLDLASNQLTRIPADAFATLPNLHTLFLDANQVTEFDSNWMTNISDSLKILSVNYNQLTTQALSNAVNNSKITLLHASGNPLNSLESFATLSLPRLTNLQLDSTGLKKIGEFDLQGMPNMQIIKLNSNDIDEIHENAFSVCARKLILLQIDGNELTDFNYLRPLRSLLGLRVVGNKINNLSGLSVVSHKLQFLYLNNNPIREVNAGIWENFTSLRELELNNCSLTEIPVISSSAPILGTLQKLQLRHNSFRTLPEHLANFRNLVELNIAHNGFQSLPQSFLADDKLQKLKIVDLSNNRIEDSPTLFIQRHPTMNQLNCSYNLITNIETNTTIRSYSLSRLDVSHNRIDTIESKAFNGIKSGTHIYLDSNQITFLPGDLFNYEESHTISLSFEHNPFRCDCRGNWMHRIVHNGGKLEPAVCSQDESKTILTHGEWDCEGVGAVTTTTTTQPPTTTTTSTQPPTTTTTSTQPPTTTTTSTQPPTTAEQETTPTEGSNSTQQQTTMQEQRTTRAQEQETTTRDELSITEQTTQEETVTDFEIPEEVVTPLEVMPIVTENIPTSTDRRTTEPTTTTEAMTFQTEAVQPESTSKPTTALEMEKVTTDAEAPPDAKQTDLERSVEEPKTGKSKDNGSWLLHSSLILIFSTVVVSLGFRL